MVRISNGEDAVPTQTSQYSSLRYAARLTSSPNGLVWCWFARRGLEGSFHLHDRSDEGVWLEPVKQPLRWWIGNFRGNGDDFPRALSTLSVFQRNGAMVYLSPTPSNRVLMGVWEAHKRVAEKKEKKNTHTHIMIPNERTRFAGDTV